MSISARVKGLLLSFFGNLLRVAPAAGPGPPCVQGCSGPLQFFALVSYCTIPSEMDAVSQEPDLSQKPDPAACDPVKMY